MSFPFPIDGFFKSGIAVFPIRLQELRIGFIIFSLWIVIKLSIFHGECAYKLPSRYGACRSPALGTGPHTVIPTGYFIGVRIDHSKNHFGALFLEGNIGIRSEEHTSELQSRENLVCR